MIKTAEEVTDLDPKTNNCSTTESQIYGHLHSEQISTNFCVAATEVLTDCRPKTFPSLVQILRLKILSNLVFHFFQPVSVM
jgi:hypothetical protein